VSGLVRLALLLEAAAVAAGCTVKLDDDPSMAYACRLRECVCHPQVYSVHRAVETLPVEWRQNGEPFCPQGFVLRQPREAGSREYPDRPKEFSFPRLF
jgi:hypothetical protein